MTASSTSPPTAETGGRLLRWFAAAAASPGRRHVNVCAPCEDAVATWSDSSRAAVAVSDGAGSARHARAGAEVIVRAAVDVLAAAPADPSLDELRSAILGACLERLRERARALGAEPNELAATLLFAATLGDDLLVGNLGDGAALGLDENGVARAVLPPERGEFANETYFVTSGCALERLRCERLDATRWRGVLLTTDGAAASLCQQEGRQIAPAVVKLLQLLDVHPPRDAEALLARKILPVFLRRTTDDCSLGLLYGARISCAELRERSPAYQRALLDTGNARGSRNRLAVAELLLAGRNTAQIAEQTGLTPQTVRRHARATAPLRCGAAGRPTGEPASR
ncbi:MAG: protein phosphatase 2C domain-containing protein [Planctomycetota bacterium]|nr:MAG: protein phosphatase 2C domain-containing protein [Planctomycetota bacterium]